MTPSPGADEDDLATELDPAAITGLAARYEAFGYETCDDRLFALLCDVTRLYAAAQCSPGIPRADAVCDVLDALAGNLTERDGIE